MMSKLKDPNRPREIYSLTCKAKRNKTKRTLPGKQRASRIHTLAKNAHIMTMMAKAKFLFLGLITHPPPRGRRTVLSMTRVMVAIFVCFTISLPFGPCHLGMNVSARLPHIVLGRSPKRRYCYSSLITVRHKRSMLTSDITVY